MAKRSRKEAEIGNKVIRVLNEDTGELEEHIASYTVKGFETDKDFFKLFIYNFVSIFDKIGGAKMKVIKYLMNNINASNNQVGGTLDEIATKSGTSLKTVHTTIKMLCDDIGFLVKVRTGTYMINPDILSKGGSRRRHFLLVEYAKLQGNENNQFEDENGEPVGDE